MAKGRHFAKEKGGKRRKAPFVLSIISAVILAINAITVFAAYVYRDKILAFISSSASIGAIDAESASLLAGMLTSYSLLIYAIVWLVLTVAMIWVVRLAEMKRVKWHVLLILGILVCVSGRLESGILAIIAAALYK